MFRFNVSNFNNDVFVLKLTKYLHLSLKLEIITHEENTIIHIRNVITQKSTKVELANTRETFNEFLSEFCWWQIEVRN
jgi:hypothetical protein